jgi:hypothetical protein
MAFHPRTHCFLLIAVTGLFAGCAGRPSIMPNSDKALRKTSAQFAADAARRHPYKADAPRGGEVAGRAQVGYVSDKLEVVNLSDHDWTDVEIWVNQNYVVYIPSIPQGKLKVFPFQMMFDANGSSFPTNNSKTRINKVELYMDGKMFDVTTKLAD